MHLHCFVNSYTDGSCDDACRIDACLNDGGDCDTGCVGDYCSQIFLAWSILGLGKKYNFDHHIVCLEWMPVAAAFFQTVSRYRMEHMSNACKGY